MAERCRDMEFRLYGREGDMLREWKKTRVS